MNIRPLLITLLGLACGGFAVMGIRQMNNNSGQNAAAVPVLKVVDVVMARTAIPRGHEVQADMLSVEKWPENMVPEGSMPTVEGAVGRVTLSQVFKGEPMLQGKLAAPGAGRGTGNLIKPGMRAYSIQSVNAAGIVAGLIVPGDRVDVILTVQSSSADPTGGGTSSTLLQNVEILAIDQDLDPKAENRSDPKLSTVTLLVTPKQASLLGLGQKAGVLSLTLRNPEDILEADTEPVTLADVRLREEGMSEAGGEGVESGAAAESAGESAGQSDQAGDSREGAAGDAAADDDSEDASTRGSKTAPGDERRSSKKPKRSRPSLDQDDPSGTLEEEERPVIRLSTIRTLRGSSSGVVAISSGTN